MKTYRYVHGRLLCFFLKAHFTLQVEAFNLNLIAVCKAKHSYSCTGTLYCLPTREGLVNRALKQIYGSRNRSMHRFFERAVNRGKSCCIYTCFLFLYMQHAAPLAPYIYTLTSNCRCLSADPNVVHIIALSFTPCQVDPCVR